MSKMVSGRSSAAPFDSATKRAASSKTKKAAQSKPKTKNGPANFVRWVYDTYQKQLRLSSVEGSRKFRDFLGSGDVSTFPLSGARRVQSFHITKFGYPMRRAGYVSAVLSVRVSKPQSEVYFGNAYWALKNGRAPEYLCLSPTYESRDGEYRHRFIWYNQFVEGCEQLASLLSPVEEAILDSLGKGELEIGVTFFPSEGSQRFSDFADKERLALKALTAILALDAQGARAQTLQNHANPDYIAVMKSLHAKYAKVFAEWGAQELSRIAVFKTGKENQPFRTQCGQKLTPLTIRESLEVNDINYAPWREAWVGRAATDLVVNGVAPMFPIYNNWTYLGGINRYFFENKAMRARYDRSLEARGVAQSLREARKRADASPENYRISQLDAHIYESLLYAQDYLLLTDLALCATSEYVGYTLRTLPNLTRRSEWISPARLLMYSDPARVARYLFDLCYGAHQLHTRLGVIHADLHLNNMTIYELSNQYRKAPKTTTYKKRVDNPVIAYVTGAKGESETYVFPHDGWFACLIDYSRAILGPAARPQIVKEFGEAFATKFYRNQIGRALRVIHHYAPSFVKKHQEKIKALLLSDFDRLFRVMTAVDFLAIGRNTKALLSELSKSPLRKKDKRTLKVSPKGIAMAGLIEKTALEFLIVNLSGLVSRKESAASLEQAAGTTVIAAVFEKYLFARQTTNLRKSTLVDVYNATAPLKYSGSNYENFPPWACLETLEKRLASLKTGLNVKQVTADRGTRPFLQSLDLNGFFELLQEQVRDQNEDRPVAETSSWIAE